MSLNKSQKTRSCLTRWVSATTLLTTIVFSSVFTNKAEANHCGPLDFTGTCFNHGGDANTSEIIVGPPVRRPVSSLRLVKLRNRNWGRCLNLQSATQNGVATNAWECVSHPDQEWKLEDAGNGFVKLRNKNWGRCLNLQSATQNGVTTNAWECVSHPDQEWKLEDAGNGFVKLRNKNWGRCLNLQSATQNGVTTNAWECVSHPDQEWKIESAG